MFNEKAIKEAKEVVKYLSTIWDDHKGSIVLNRGRGENYGNRPVEYSIHFQIGNKFFHYFTSDMRWHNLQTIRTCESMEDYRGGHNYFFADLDDLKDWLARKVNA